MERTCGNVGWCVSSLPWKEEARQYIRSWSPGHSLFLDHHWGQVWRRGAGGMLGDVCPLSPLSLPWGGRPGGLGRHFYCFLDTAGCPQTWPARDIVYPGHPGLPSRVRGEYSDKNSEEKKTFWLSKKIDEKCCYFCSIGNFKDKFVQLFSAQNAFFQFYCKIFTTAQCSVAADRTRWQICGGDYHESGITPSGYSIITPDRVLSREWQNSQRI